MMRGGSFGSNKAEPNGRAGHLFNASLVDVVRWLRTSFALDDFVVLKMDIEGGERDRPRAARDEHVAPRRRAAVGVPPQAARPARQVPVRRLGPRAQVTAGVKAIYHDPYPFAKASDSPEFVPG